MRIVNCFDCKNVGRGGRYRMICYCEAGNMWRPRPVPKDRDDPYEYLGPRNPGAIVTRATVPEVLEWQ